MRKKRFLVGLLLVATAILMYARESEDVWSTWENTDGWNRVYLASAPRSGNHWVRYLVEEVSGKMTGSVFHDKDPDHLRRPFPWGGYAVSGGYSGKRAELEPGDPVLLKTHFPYGFYRDKREQFGYDPSNPTVVLVRNPHDMLYSLFSYQESNPATTAAPWKSFVRGNIQFWEEFVRFWELQPGVTIMRYEDFIAQPEQQLARVLDVMGVQYTEEDLQRAVTAYPPMGSEGKHLEHFSPDEQALVLELAGDVMRRYGYL